MIEATMLNPKWFSYVATVNIVSQPTFFLPTFLTYFLLILSHHSNLTVAQNESTSIGVIIDVDSRIGKEVKTAMKMAVQNSNSNSKDRLFSLHFRNHSSNPLQAAYAAEELIREEKVQVIIGMETWQETVLVAEIGNQAQVPVLSFAATANVPLLAPLQWPFLVQMTSNFTEQMRCIAVIANFFQWRRVVAIYEVDSYGGDSGMFAALDEQLQNANSHIEHRLILPPVSSLSDPKRFVRKKLTKSMRKQSRVFIILQSSLSMATHLFKEAKQMGLMGKDSAWIVTDIIASLLDSVNNSVISSMEGAVGIKAFFSEDQRSFISFKQQFKQMFQSDYPKEDNSEPGIHSLRAFDSITTIAKAMNQLGGNSGSPSSMLLRNILSSNFTGLSGRIQFHKRELWHYPIFTIINVFGKRYKELGLWSSEFGFSENITVGESGEVNRTANNDGGENMEALANLVIWPGNLKRAPKGWAMPSDANRMKIGVPGRTSFNKFVKVEAKPTDNSSMSYSGFCIDVFNEVLKLVEQNYPLPHDFLTYNGTYDDLVDHVSNKTFDAVIGDVTILANRSRHVEFTQPFAESCLTMIVTEKPEAGKAWMFLKPFTKGMWAATCAILIYTVFIVWLLERQSNPEFEGPWRNQLGTAFWFTYSSLFFAQRERIHSSYTRVVVLVWLFVVLALTSSYTASLSSMLTVSRLEPNVTDVEWLKSHNAKIGCDGDSFVRKYLVDVLKFKGENIKNIAQESDYPDEFESGNITAAILELPYEKAFLMCHCNGYTGTNLPDRFGGLGFVFQKGSPIAADFSEAILNLSENGVLTQLESKWFSPTKECLASKTTSTTDSLSWQSFWGLYMFSGITSTVCYLLFFIHRWFCQHHHDEPYEGNSTTNVDNSSNNKLVELFSYFHKKKMKGPARGATRISHTPEEDELSSPSWESSEMVVQVDTSQIFDPYMHSISIFIVFIDPCV